MRALSLPALQLHARNLPSSRSTPQQRPAAAAAAQHARRWRRHMHAAPIALPHACSALFSLLSRHTTVWQRRSARWRPSSSCRSFQTATGATAAPTRSSATSVSGAAPRWAARAPPAAAAAAACRSLLTPELPAMGFPLRCSPEDGRDQPGLGQRLRRVWQHQGAAHGLPLLPPARSEPMPRRLVPAALPWPLSPPTLPLLPALHCCPDHGGRVRPAAERAAHRVQRAGAHQRGRQARHICHAAARRVWPGGCCQREQQLGAAASASRALSGATASLPCAAQTLRRPWLRAWCSRGGRGGSPQAWAARRRVLPHPYQLLSACCFPFSLPSQTPEERELSAALATALEAAANLASFPKATADV